MTLRDRLRAAVSTVRDAVATIAEAGRGGVARIREFRDGLAEIAKLIRPTVESSPVRSPPSRPQPSSPPSVVPQSSPASPPVSFTPPARLPPPLSSVEPSPPAVPPLSLPPSQPPPPPGPVLVGRALEIIELLEEAQVTVGIRQLTDALDGYPTGRYKDAEAEEVLRFLDERLRIWVTPQQLYFMAGIPQSSIRRELRRLLGLGFVETNGKGGYALAVEPLSVGELPTNGDQLRRRGVRWWIRKDGSFGIAIFNPSKSYRPMRVFSGSTVGQGRKAGFSKHRGKDLPVLALATSEPYEIVDLDRVPDLIPSHALAMQRTEHGVHLYFRRGEVPKNLDLDTDYRRYSLSRGTWNERLYNSDGTRRELIRALCPEGEAFATEHNAAFRAAWDRFESDKAAA